MNRNTVPPPAASSSRPPSPAASHFTAADSNTCATRNLNARQWQIDRKPGDVSGKDNEHEFGFHIGGPVKIPKIYNTDRARTFFYLDVEAFRQRGGASVTRSLTLPTAQERTGNFSDWPTNIYDPLTTRVNPAFNPSWAD